MTQKQFADASHFYIRCEQSGLLVARHVALAAGIIAIQLSVTCSCDVLYDIKHYWLKELHNVNYVSDT